jgi:quercetin dioxygenase-like cupin family protein
MRRWIILAGLAAAATTLVVIVATAFASPGTPTRRHAVTLATGVESDGIKTHAVTVEGKKARIWLRTKEKTHVVMQEITYDPGGAGSLASASGWHHHPGFVLSVVKSGQFKFYEEMGHHGRHAEHAGKVRCTVRTLNPGDVFVESGTSPGNLRNETASPAVVLATFVVPYRTPAPVLRAEDSVRCGVDP